MSFVTLLLGVLAGAAAAAAAAAGAGRPHEYDMHC